MNAKQMKVIQDLTQRLDRNSRAGSGGWAFNGELSFTAEPLADGAIMVTASNTETRNYPIDIRTYVLAIIGVRGGIKLKRHEGNIYDRY